MRVNFNYFHCTFFTRKVSTVILLKEVIPSPNRKMIKLLTFWELAPVTKTLLKLAVEWRWLSRFPAKMTLVHARAPLSIEKISALDVKVSNSWCHRKFPLWYQTRSQHQLRILKLLLSYRDVRDSPGTNTRVVWPSSSSSASQQRQGNTTGDPLGAVTSTSSTNTPWLGDSPSCPRLILRTCKNKWNRADT